MKNMQLTTSDKTTMTTTGRFMIQLENDRPAVFNPGEKINATVIYLTSDKESYNSFYVKIKGYGHVSWDIGSGDDKSNFSDKETYLDFKIPILPNEGSRKEHKPGQNLYNFNFTLPFNIPSSYEYKRGFVRYTMKAAMKRSIIKRDLVARIPFVVTDGVVDLNQNEAALIAPKNSVIKSGTLLNSGTTKVETSCDRTGFIPGEIIKLDAKIVCSGGRALRSYEVRLMQYTTFIAKTSRNRMTQIIWKQKEKRIDKRDIHNFKIPVPIPTKIPLSGKLHCRLIEIDYAVELIADSGFFSANLVSSLKILIGNAPLPVRPATNILNEVAEFPRPLIESTRGFGNTSSRTTSQNHERRPESRRSLQFHSALESRNEVTFVVLPEVTVSRTDDESPPPSYESCVEKNGFRFHDETKL